MIYLACDEIQRQIITCPARDIIYIAGRRVGKTRGVFRGRACTSMLAYAGFKYWYLTPSYAQLLEEYEAISTVGPILHRLAAKNKQPYPRIQMKNGSNLGLRSFDRPDNLRGSGLWEVAFDEIQDSGSEEDFLAVINPLLKDARALTKRWGVLLTMGQFRGRNWYFQSQFLPGMVNRALVAGRDMEWLADFMEYKHEIEVHPKELEDVKEKFCLSKDRLDYAAFLTSAYDGLIYRSEFMQRELEREKRKLPRVVFDQEYRCIPTANSASVFRFDDIQASIGGRYLPSGSSNGQFIVAVDLGRVVDRCGIVVSDCSSREVVFSELRPEKEKHIDTARRVKVIQAMFNGALVIVDATGGATGGHHDSDEFVKLYRAEVPNLRTFHQNFHNKNEAVKALSLAFELRNMTISKENSQLLNQLEAYEYTHKGDRIIYHGPGGHSDDLVSAMYMSVWAWDRGWGPMGGGAAPDAVL